MELIPTIDKYSRYYKKTDGTWGVKNRMINACWRMWQGCVITWNGGIVPCCFDKDATHQLGQLSETEISNQFGKVKNIKAFVRPSLNLVQK